MTAVNALPRTIAQIVTRVAALLRPVTDAPQQGSVTKANARISLTQDGADATVPFAAFARAIGEQLATTYLGTLSIVEPMANAIYQRDTMTGGLWSRGVGAVPLTVTATAAVLQLDYRVINAADNAVLLDWTSAGVYLAAGVHTVNVNVPAGLYKYRIALRANTDATSVKTTTNAVMVGDVIAVAGQSLAQGMLTNVVTGDTTTFEALDLTVSPWGWVLASWALNSGGVPQGPDFSLTNYPPTAWELPSNAGRWKSAYAVRYMNRMIEETGVPCGMAGFVVGGTGIDTWLPGYSSGAGTPKWDNLVAILRLAGGKFAAFKWVQGHYQAKDGSTAETYRPKLDLLYASIVAAFPLAAPTFRMIVSTIPGIHVYSGSTPSTVSMVRAVAKAFTAATPRSAYVDGLDAALWDGVHPSQAGNVTYADHFARATLKLLGAIDFGDAGPEVLSAARAYGSPTIWLTCSNPNGATGWSLNGDARNQFTIYSSGATSGPKNIASIDTSDFPRLGVVLADLADYNAAQAFDVWVRRPWDTTAIIAAGVYDNVTVD